MIKRALAGATRRDVAYLRAVENDAQHLGIGLGRRAGAARIVISGDIDHVAMRSTTAKGVITVFTPRRI
jgi:hypothetical protein